jgi:hypothetical protein
MMSLKWHIHRWKDQSPMSNSFLNWTSRVAIAGRVAEERRSESGNELTLPGDYHMPFDKTEAQRKATKWLWQAYLI